MAAASPCRRSATSSPRRSRRSWRASSSSISEAARACRRPRRSQRPWSRPRSSRPRPRHRPPSRRLLLGGALLSSAAADAAEELGERPHLLLVEHTGELVLDVRDVPRGGLLEFGQPGLGEDRVADTGVLLAGALPDQALVLEPVEQAGDPRRRETELVREVDSAHALVARSREEQQAGVVVDREPVLGDQGGTEPAGKG